MRKTNLKELNRLEELLKETGIDYERRDEEGNFAELIGENLDFHQICVPSVEAFRNNVPGSWDAVCHYGSYGYLQGLLEVYGSMEERDQPVGWLTAEEVMKRAKEKGLLKGVNDD